MVFKFLIFHSENKFSIVRNEIPNSYNNFNVNLKKFWFPSYRDPDKKNEHQMFTENSKREKT